MFSLSKISFTSRRLATLNITYRHSSSHNQYSETHYDVLGVSKDASSGEIKKAYYEQSMRHHPDKKDGSQERFREITHAYEVLGNVKLRKMYDKGLIRKDSNIIYESESTASPNESDAPVPPPRDSYYAPALEQWSKEQYSQTFVRDQERRAALKYKNVSQTRKQEISHTQGLMFWFTAALFILIGYQVERSGSAILKNKSDESSKKSDSKS